MTISGRTAAAIAASIEGQLQRGRSAPGDVLPTVRDLSSRLRVSPATVAAAYKLLRTRGLIAGAGRRGTRFVPRPPLPTSAVTPSVPHGLADLASGNPDPALLPPLDPALRGTQAGQLLYAEEPPDRPLRTFAAMEFEQDGIPAQHTAVLSGALDAIERILREHLRPGDRIALEDPCLPAVLDLVSASGFTSAPVPVDESGPLPDALEAALHGGARAVVLTPRAQNPTGAALTAERAAALQRVLRRFPDAVLIENDYAAPIAGVALHSLCAAPRGRWAIVRSTSKFLGPDLRVAVMAGDELTVARVRGRVALGMRWVSRILQDLVLALWSDPSGGRRLARAAEIYAQRRQALQTALASHGLHAVPGQSGFNIWVPVRDEGHVVRALAARGWAVAAGERFRIQTGPAIRVTTSTLEPADASRFAADLAAALRPATSLPA